MKPENYTLPNGLNILQININETNFMYQEIFEDNDYCIDEMILKEGDTVFDIGANIGMFSMFMGQKRLNLNIFAFEPIPDLFQVLKKNMIVHCKNSRQYNIGFSNIKKKEMITYYPNTSIMTSVYADKNLDEQCYMETVFSKEMGEEEAKLLLKYKEQLLDGRFDSIQIGCEMETLDDFIRENQIERIDLLKIDAEKSEVDILEGLKNESNKVYQMVIEVHGTCHLQRVTQLLKELEYKINVKPLGKSEKLFMLYARKLR